MTGSERQQTTSSGSKESESLSPWPELPETEHVSLDQEAVGSRYGLTSVVSPERRHLRGEYRLLVECRICGAMSWRWLSNLKQVKPGKGCKSCLGRRSPGWLMRKATDARGRSNLGLGGYTHVEFRFESSAEMAEYLWENQPNLDSTMELDRIDTRGHYEKGNVRLVPRSLNQRNKIGTVLTEWDQQYWPYCEGYVQQLLTAGMSRDEVISQAEETAKSKGPYWMTMKLRLESMTYSMPDHVLVSPYRGG